MKIRLFSTSISSLFPILFLISCKKLIDAEPPRNQVITTQVFSDSTNADAAILGMYIQLMGTPFSFTFFNGGITTYTGLMSDELYSTKGNSQENEFYQNSISPDNSIVAESWKNAYTIIYQANANIEALSESKNLKQATKDILLGEAKLVRALVYFNLVNLFGKVPLILTTDYRVNMTTGRTAVDSIYKAIIEDLSDSEKLLPDIRTTTGKTRPTKHAALALLARVYLFNGDWARAEEASNKIITSGLYSLNPDLDKIFGTGNTEAIWQLPPVQPGGFETTEGMQFVPFSPNALPNYPVSTNLIQCFEPGDLRKSKWLAFNTVNSQSYYYPYKYKLNYSGSSSPKEHYMMFRVAEQFLIRAEARAHQNKTAEALADLNVIRVRAGLAQLVISDQNYLLDKIADERRVEFFCEWGHRWYDLKRSNKINNILGIAKSPNWQETDALLPIPFKETQLNPFLTQNPGY